MKTSHTLLAIAFTLLSVIIFPSCNQVDQPQKNIIGGNKKLNDEWLSGEVTPGLHLLTIDDTTSILIYRGYKSVSMIQIK